MVRQSVFVLDRRGFSLVELIVVMAIVATTFAVTAPSMITYWRSATLKAAAEEMVTGLNRARQLAISQSQRVCVEIVGNQYRYWFNGCGTTLWTGSGTDLTGFFRLANNVGVAANANPEFNYLGAANQGATLTVTNPQGGGTLAVVVSVAGRVRICPPAGCAP